MSLSTGRYKSEAAASLAAAVLQQTHPVPDDEVCRAVASRGRLRSGRRSSARIGRFSRSRSVGPEDETEKSSLHRNINKHCELQGALTQEAPCVSRNSSHSRRDFLSRGRTSCHMVSCCGSGLTGIPATSSCGSVQGAAAAHCGAGRETLPEPAEEGRGGRRRGGRP